MRSGSEVALLMLDIDDFKRINDELGHRKGDEALTAVADIIRRNLRKVDIPFRYGGEEIVILLPGTSRFESVHTAERLRRRIGEHDAFRDLHGRSRRITVSVGVGVYPETARTAEELFLQADAAMYRAKETGKNRVVLYSEGMAMGRDRS
jgi:diguanylate cyclase (GGDEF)-like protein